MSFVTIVSGCFLLLVILAAAAYDPPRRRPDWRDLSIADRLRMWRERDDEHYSSDEAREYEALRLGERFLPFEEFGLRRTARGYDAQQERLGYIRQRSVLNEIQADLQRAGIPHDVPRKPYLRPPTWAPPRLPEAAISSPTHEGSAT
jgi:hypothetical protein